MTFPQISKNKALMLFGSLTLIVIVVSTVIIISLANQQKITPNEDIVTQGSNDKNNDMKPEIIITEPASMETLDEATQQYLIDDLSGNIITPEIKKLAEKCNFKLTNYYIPQQITSGDVVDIYMTVSAENYSNDNSNNKCNIDLFKSDMFTLLFTWKSGTPLILKPNEIVKTDVGKWDLKYQFDSTNKSGTTEIKFIFLNTILKGWVIEILPLEAVKKHYKVELDDKYFTVAQGLIGNNTDKIYANESTAFYIKAKVYDENGNLVTNPKTPICAKWIAHYTDKQKEMEYNCFKDGFFVLRGNNEAHNMPGAIVVNGSSFIPNKYESVTLEINGGEDTLFTYIPTFSFSKKIAINYQHWVNPPTSTTGNINLSFTASDGIHGVEMFYGATVHLYEHGNTTEIAKATPNYQYYSFQNLKPGLYDIQAQYETYKSETYQVTVTAGASIAQQLRITLPNMEIVDQVNSLYIKFLAKGWIHDLAYTGISGVTAKVRLTSSPETVVSQCITNEFGYFECNGLNQNISYTVEIVVPEGYSQKELVLNYSSSTKDVFKLSYAIPELYVQGYTVKFNN